MVSLTDLQIEVVREFERFRRSYKENAEKIKEIASRLFGDVEVYVFGSVVEGKVHPMSDVDIAVVVGRADEEERVRLYGEVRKTFGPLHPFEIHVLTEGEWMKYKKFIRKYLKI